MDFLDTPGPCGICGAAHTTCKGDRDDSTGVGVTRGVIIRQLPQRDAAVAVSARQAQPMSALAPAALDGDAPVPVPRPGRQAIKGQTTKPKN